MPTTTQNPQSLPSKGTPVFMPQSAAIIAGVSTKSVRTVSVFMTTLRLLEMMEA